MARLATTTAQTVQRAVTDTVTELATHRAGLGLALIPQTGVKTSDVDGGRQIFDKGDLGHTRTILNARQARVKLRRQGVEYSKLAEEDLDGFIRHLRRQIAKINQAGTGIHRSNAKVGTAEGNTTSKGRIALGRLLEGHSNNAIRDKLDALDISNIQGLHKVGQDLGRTSRAVDSGWKVHRQSARTLNDIRHDKNVSRQAPKLSPDEQGTQQAGRPKKAKNYRVKPAFPGGCFPAGT